MFTQLGFQSLAFTFLFGRTIALDLDTNNQESIKSAAKTLATGIVSAYNENLKSDLVPGLFGDPYYFWEAGAVWGGLIEYAHLTGDTQYNNLTISAVLHQLGDQNVFMPQNQSKTLGNDDQSYWGLMAMTAAETGLEMPEKDYGSWSQLAANVFDTQVLRWNEEKCGGGLKWQIFPLNNGFNYRNSISTGNFFLLSARLAQFTGNTTYSEWAEKALKWTQDIGFVTEDYHVFDGGDDTQGCENINTIQWTVNSAVFAEGAAVMYNLTKGDNKWKDVVAGFVKASSVFQANGSSILTEVACERVDTCNIDQRAFKGIAIRSWARAAQAAPFTSDSIKKTIEASATGAAKNCESDDDDVKCGFKWTSADNDADSVKDGGLGEAHNALQAVQALLWPQAKALSSQNSTSPGAAPGNGAPQEPTTDSPGAAGILTTSPVFLLMATVLAMLCL